MVHSTSGGSDRRDVTASGVPTIDVDPYTTEVLTDPYPFHHELREAGPVFEETIRLESPVQQFFRTAAHDTELGGVEIAEDERVMIFFGSANRDPRQWEDPDRFDVTRKPSGHLAFGTGIHGCLGQLIARTEGEMLFAALARKIGRIELDGELQRHLNNSVRRLASLPVTFHAP